jgi:hypothetical protein
MMRNLITTRKVQEITGLAASTSRAGKAGTHGLSRVEHGRSYRYLLVVVEAFAEGKLKVKRAKQPPLNI